MEDPDWEKAKMHEKENAPAPQLAASYHRTCHEVPRVGMIRYAEYSQ